MIGGERASPVATDPPDGSRPRVASSEPDGTYRLANIPPGHYKLAIAWKTDNGGWNGEGLDDYPEASAIAIAAGDKLTKDLKAPEDQ